MPAIVRRAVDELVEEQQRADLLRAHGLEPRHRVLLVGPPGTGKTTLAEAIAESAGVPLFVVRYETMIGSYLGETATRLKRLFDYARTTPCVLFFDEFDAIGKERGDHPRDRRDQTCRDLTAHAGRRLAQLHNYRRGHETIPSFSTALRGGACQLRLPLLLPDSRALTRYIQSFSERLSEPLGQTPSAIARRLGRISYAEAEQFCLDVQRRSVLAIGQKAVKAIVAEQLNVWDTRARAGRTGKGGMKDGRASSTESFRLLRPSARRHCRTAATNRSCRPGEPRRTGIAPSLRRLKAALNRGPERVLELRAGPHGTCTRPRPSSSRSPARLPTLREPPRGVPGLELMVEYETESAPDEFFAKKDTRKGREGQRREDKLVDGTLLPCHAGRRGARRIHPSVGPLGCRAGTRRGPRAVQAPVRPTAYCPAMGAAEDRIPDETIAYWWKEARRHPDRPDRTEVELWYRRTPERREQARLAFRALVAAAGGTVLHEALIPEIAYQGVLDRHPRGRLFRR